MQANKLNECNTVELSILSNSSVAAQRWSITLLWPKPWYLFQAKLYLRARSMTLRMLLAQILAVSISVIGQKSHARRDLHCHLTIWWTSETTSHTQNVALDQLANFGIYLRLLSLATVSPSKADTVMAPYHTTRLLRSSSTSGSRNCITNTS